jgi:hypothetical protein
MGGVEILFEPNGPAGVIYAFEYLFSPGGEYRHGGISLTGEAGGYLIDREGVFYYRQGLDLIEIGEEASNIQGRHNRTDIRGSLERSRSEFSVYRTGTLPGSRRITIRKGDKNEY